MMSWVIACPPGAAGWRRFALATETLIYHELALVAAAIAVVSLTWGEPNQVGTWTFVILWVMRQSAKMNVFLGVRNLSEEFLPPHLQYLKSFFRRRPMNLLFPVSVTASTVVAVLLFKVALQAEAASFDQAAFLFLATLLTLAVLEHWFLVIPLPVGALWNWSLRSRDVERPAAALVPVVEVPVSKPLGRDTDYLRSRPN
jgi:putative photosynthetic complex assembly protein 2